MAVPRICPAVRVAGIVAAGFGLVVAVWHSPATAAGYVELTGGGGGPSREVSIGGEGGWTGRNLMVGGGLWYMRADQADAAHYKPTVEVGGYGALGFRIGTGLFVVGKIGYAERSRVPMLMGLEGDPEILGRHLSPGGSVRYTRKPLIVDLGYEGRRGIVAGVGYAF